MKKVFSFIAALAITLPLAAATYSAGSGMKDAGSSQQVAIVSVADVTQEPDTVAPDTSKTYVGAYDVGDKSFRMEPPPPVKNNKEKIFSVAEQMPKFYGNKDAWIAQNLVYPADAAEMGVQGKVIVKFVVEKDGSISRVSIARGVSPSVDKEAMRLVKAMPKWVPGKVNGNNVAVWVMCPITFILR